MQQRSQMQQRENKGKRIHCHNCDGCEGARGTLFQIVARKISPRDNKPPILTTASQREI